MSAEKRLGKFNYPLTVGTIVQDLGLSGFDIPIPLYFDGPNNDQQSWAFLLACAEFGQWTIIHPVRGTIKAQLVSVASHDESVESGNITVVDTSWIIPNALNMGMSNADYGAQIDNGIAQLGADSASQFASISTAIDSLAAAYGAVTSGLGAMQNWLTQTTAKYLTIYAQVSGAISALSNDVLSIAGLVTNLIQLPGIMVGSLSSQVKNFVTAGEIALGLVPGLSSPATPAAYAQTAGAELIATAITGAMAQTLISTPPTTKAEALNTIDLVFQWWVDLFSALDSAESIFSNSLLANAYISESSAYVDMTNLFTLMIKYLLSIIFDLSAEIRFTLPSERAPIAVALDYYGRNGWDDSYLDFFIVSNGLYGDLVNLLPAGTKISIFPGAVGGRS